MTTRKRTNDNSSNFMLSANISRTEHVLKNGSYFPSETPPKPKTASFPKKQNKKLLQNDKNFFETY